MGTSCRFRVGALGLLLGLAAAGPDPAPAQLSENRLSSARPGAESLATAEDRSARLTVPVMIDGHGPYPFVVDTGANRSVISRELATTLKLPAGPQVALDDALVRERVDTVLIDRLDVGRRQIRAVEAPVLPASDLGADGMLGIDSLRGQHVVLDFKARRLLVAPSGEADDFAANATIVQGRRRFGQLVLVDAESQTRPIFVILDSGAQNTIGNDALRRLMRFDAGGGARLPVERLISVTGKQTLAELDEMPEIRLGEVTIQHAPVAYASLHTFTQFGLDDRPALLLGMDVLHAFRSVSIDFRRREVLFVLP